MGGHKEWLQAGFDRGIFVLSGSIQPNAGGGIVAINVVKEEIEGIIAEDPFVIENVVWQKVAGTRRCHTMKAGPQSKNIRELVAALS
ncbi:YciI family protein [Thalassotalea fusca]